MKDDRNVNYFTVVAIVYIAALLISNIAAQKLILVGPFVFTGGVMLFPITFIFNDLMTEVWSYKKTRIIIWTGFGCSLFMSLFLYLIVQAKPAPGWEFQDAFQTTFALVPRVVTASLLAYFCGEFMNSFVLSKMKLADKNKKMGLRFILSTVVGDAVDTVIFAAIALYGIVPNETLLTSMWSGYLFKVLYEIIAMPISVPLTKWFKKKANADIYDYDTNYNPFKLN